MEAIRETVDVVGHSVTIALPAGFTARRVEVIVLAVPEQDSPAQHPYHRPAPELAHTVILDDLIAPAVSADDWDALK